MCEVGANPGQAPDKQPKDCSKWRFSLLEGQIGVGSKEQEAGQGEEPSRFFPRKREPVNALCALWVSVVDFGIRVYPCLSVSQPAALRK
jgi:hypothetical protein